MAGDKSVPTQNGNVTMVFDEDVAVGKGSVRIVTSIGGISTATVDVSVAGAVHIDGRVATVRLPAAALELDTTTYHVRVSPGAFVDARGNPFAGVNSKRWSFTTLDATPPTLSSIVPNNGHGSVQRGIASLKLVFSEPVIAAGGVVNITSLSAAGTLRARDGQAFADSVHDLVPVLDPTRVTVTGDTVVVRPRSSIVNL